MREDAATEYNRLVGADPAAAAEQRVIDHCEQPSLTEKAPMNEDPVAPLATPARTRKPKARPVRPARPARRPSRGVKAAHRRRR